MPYQVPYRSREGLRVRRSYNPLSLGDATPATACPTRPLWWLLVAAAAGGAAAYYGTKPKKKGRR